MRKESRLHIAAGQARLVLRDLGVTELPVEPKWIAEENEILVQAKPASARGVSGMLIRNGNDFAIAYATHIRNPGFERFSIAHELGHFFIPGHPESVFRSGPVHESRGGFCSGDNIEIEADHFAAALLMPKALFQGEIRKQTTENLDLILALADACKSSRTATAIRYTELADVPVAVVVSRGPRIDYCFMSEGLRELPGLDWPRKGSVVPAGSATQVFNGDPEKVRSGERTDNLSALSDWFGGRWEVECLEEVLGLGAYERTLTVIAPVGVWDIEELLEDEELVDSWTPRFRR